MAGKQDPYATIDAFLKKVASAPKRAEDDGVKDPGQITGPTDHPVKSDDNSTEPATEGSQTAFNVKKVKEEQPAGVDQRPEPKSALELLAVFAKQSLESATTPGSAAADQFHTGTKKTPTGEDAEHETGMAGATKKDSPTTHPARTDNDALDGHKYAAATADMPLSELLILAKEAGDALCAALTSAAQPAKPQAKSAGDPPLTADAAYRAGWELAGIANGTFDKNAADALVRHHLEDVVRTADLRAGMVVDFWEARVKAAAGPPPEEEAAAPPGAGGGGEGPPVMPPGAGGPPPGVGGPPGMGEGDIMSALSGAGPDQQADQLIQQLLALGIPPEQIEQLVMEAAQGGAGGGGGMPPGAGGPPPMGGGAMPPMGGPPPGPPPDVKAASDRTPADAEKSAAQAAQMRGYLKELVARSNANRRLAA